jgi:hypothetical protein
MATARGMAAFVTIAVHDGSPWVVLACIVLFVSVVVALYTRSDSGVPGPAAEFAPLGHAQIDVLRRVGAVGPHV